MHFFARLITFSGFSRRGTWASGFARNLYSFQHKRYIFADIFFTSFQQFENAENKSTQGKIAWDRLVKIHSRGGRSWKMGIRGGSGKVTGKTRRVSTSAEVHSIGVRSSHKYAPVFVRAYLTSPCRPARIGSRQPGPIHPRRTYDPWFYGVLDLILPRWPRSFQDKHVSDRIGKLRTVVNCARNAIYNGKNFFFFFFLEYRIHPGFYVLIKSLEAWGISVRFRSRMYSTDLFHPRRIFQLNAFRSSQCTCARTPRRPRQVLLWRRDGGEKLRR